MRGKMVRFEDAGKSFQGYLSAPENGGAGVIVLQEWWGLNDQIKEVCDRLAEQGFTALAPDLYEGTSTSDPDEAGRLMMALSIDHTAHHLNAAVDYLLSLPECSSTKVGVVGFCMGGQLALYAISINQKIAICANFYGIHSNVHPKFEQIKGKVLGFFGKEDHLTTPDAVASLEAKLTEHGVDFEFRSYEGAQHAFTNHHRPEVYDPEASEDSWKHMISEFRKALAD
jgi:carboxymethylenebutenolidase